MMIGTILWNVIGASVAFVGTFLLSIQTNLLLTSLLRGLYSFVIMFVLVFIVRFVIGLILMPSTVSNNPTSDAIQNENMQSEAHVGQRFDFVTPDDETNKSESNESTFSPLNPPKLETKIESDPERLAKAVRHLSAD